MRGAKFLLSPLLVWSSYMGWKALSNHQCLQHQQPHAVCLELFMQLFARVAICGKSWDLVKHNIGNMSLCNQVMKNLNCFVHVECLSIQLNSNFAPHLLQHLYISLEKYKYKSQEGRKWVEDALKTPCIWSEWTNKSENVWNLTQPEKYSKQSRNNSDGKVVGKHVTMCLE